jgi:hypothetical protein
VVSGCPPASRVSSRSWWTMSKLSFNVGAVTSPKYSMRMSRKVRMNAKAYNGSTFHQYQYEWRARKKCDHGKRLTIPRDGT